MTSVPSIPPKNKQVPEGDDFENDNENLTSGDTSPVARSETMQNTQFPSHLYAGSQDVSMPTGMQVMSEAEYYTN